MLLLNYLIYCGEVGIEEEIKISPNVFPVSSKIDSYKNCFSFNSISKIEFRQEKYFFIISAPKNYSNLASFLFFEVQTHSS